MVKGPRLRLGQLALPHVLHVGVTTMCNLSCPACPTGSDGQGAGQHLDFDLYRRTVDELRSALMLAMFWDWGEPMMHPRLTDMIEYAGRSRIMTVLSTNANVANSERQIERLVSARPSAIIVCVDGADQATYEKYRAGGKLAKVLETLTRLRQAKEAQRSPYPVTDFRVLAFRHNERQMPDLLGMAEDYGADLFSVKSHRPFNYRGQDLDESLAPLDASLSRYSYRQPGRRAANERVEFAQPGPLRCAKPYFSPTLNSDGTLAFCSYTVNRWELFGNLADGGFAKVWGSPFAGEIRRRFTRMGGSECCTTCYFRTGHKPTILHQVPLRPMPPDISLLRPKTQREFLDAVAPIEPDLTESRKMR
jgi:MoaA/NifB/PqqE/SkfB family radical SAM enzyme